MIAWPNIEIGAQIVSRDHIKSVLGAAQNLPATYCNMKKTTYLIRW